MQTSDIIKKVRRLEIRTRHLVTDALSGAYHSSFKGRGMDFEEVREYAIGDDVRAIDWNVSAKMDKPFVKLFREERELTLMLLVDLSASGIFGSVEQSKRERAAEIASVLAFSATLNNDKVGLIGYTDRVEHYLPPKKGRRHVLRLIRDILAFQPEGRGTGHRCALDYLNRVQRRRSVVFLISDFLAFQPEGRGTGHRCALDYLNRVQRRRSVVFLISDFLDNQSPDLPESPTSPPRPSSAKAPPPSRRSPAKSNPSHPHSHSHFHSHSHSHSHAPSRRSPERAKADHSPPPLFQSLALTNQRHDLVSIALSDPREERLPDIGIVALEDAETGEVVEIDTGSAALRQRYADAARRRRAEFQSNMRKKGLDWIEARTDQPYLPALRRLFARRASRH